MTDPGGLSPPPPSAPRVQVSHKGATAILTLQSPPMNLLSSDLLDELLEHLRVAEADPEVRALVLVSGLERIFTAGANIREMASMDSRQAERHSRKGQDLTRWIESCPLPVIAAVSGTCVGGGCEIVEACDFVLASEDATFGQPEIKIGVLPGWGGSQRLPRRIGAQGARAWILLGDTVSAEAAREAGLVWMVVPRDQLLPEAVRLGERLAQRPAAAVAAAKEAVNDAVAREELRGLAHERRLWAELFGTHDQREGMTAFLEKRPAVFAPRRGTRIASRSRSRRRPRHRPPRGASARGRRTKRG